MIKLLSDAISFGIRQLIVRLDSQLIVLNLNGVYSIRSASMLRMFCEIFSWKESLIISSINIFREI